MRCLPAIQSSLHLHRRPLKEDASCLLQVDDWGAFDVFKVAGLTQGRPLETVALAVLHRFDLVEKLQLPEAKLRAFLRVRNALAMLRFPPRFAHHA